jgi:hypothetical protein
VRNNASFERVNLTGFERSKATPGLKRLNFGWRSGLEIGSRELIFRLIERKPN